MDKLSVNDLCSLEQYARERSDLRARVMQHKRHRRLAVGPHTTWNFEDRLSVQYQIQEMLRVERIFEPAGIQEELDAYNPLIPDGGNWKVTLLIEFPDPAQRRAELARLRGIEARCWVRVAGHEPVFAVFDEDLERSTPEKTAAVHFLRFELRPAMIAALRDGAALAVGIDHDQYRYSVEPVQDPVRAALLADFA